MTSFWVGSYTADMGGTAAGIGWLDEGGYRPAAAAESPSFLALHPSLPVLYAVLEGAGRLEAWRVEGPGELRPLGGIDLGGGIPCHLAVTDARATIACYGDGRLITVTLAADGRPERVADVFEGQGSGPHPDQANARAHSTVEIGGLVLAADLGADLVRVFRRAGDTLAPSGEVRMPPGSGPRDLIVHPSGRVLVLTELDPLVATLAIEGDSVALVASAPLATDAETSEAAATLALSADGRFATGGLRRVDRLGVVEVASDGTVLGAVASVALRTAGPRNHVLVGDTVFVGGQLSDTVETLRLGAEGRLEPFGDLVAAPSPTQLLPAAGARWS
jgi:6-phosphogluconolactonase (cycloisomerase 2 family)